MFLKNTIDTFSGERNSILKPEQVGRMRFISESTVLQSEVKVVGKNVCCKLDSSLEFQTTLAQSFHGIWPTVNEKYMRSFSRGKQFLIFGKRLLIYSEHVLLNFIGFCMFRVALMKYLQYV